MTRRTRGRVAFGASVITIALGGLWQALGWTGLQVPLTIPWPAPTTITATCGGIVLAAATVPAVLLARANPAGPSPKPGRAATRLRRRAG